MGHNFNHMKKNLDHLTIILVLQLVDELQGPIAGPLLPFITGNLLPFFIGFGNCRGCWNAIDPLENDDA